VEYRDAPFYLSLGDIAIAPKMSDTEGSGKVLNYMALGQPIVVYDSPVHREYLAEFGVYAASGDVGELTTAVAGLSHNPEQRAWLGEQLRKRAMTQFSWKTAGRQIVNLYDELTAS